jgi:transposase
MLKRWDKFTLFYGELVRRSRMDICERALKLAICDRRNSLVYRTQDGASVGDMFTSRIHTAELRGENPFDYLTVVQRHAKAVANCPQDRLRWT